MVFEVCRTAFEYKDDRGNVFEGVLCKPKNLVGKTPGVLVYHTFAGCTDFEASRAAKLAELGYIALAADVYGKGIRGKSFEENFSIMKPLIAERGTTLKDRLFCSLNALKSVENVLDDKIAAIGYCFGGLCAMDLGRHGSGIVAAVSYHGTLTPLGDNERNAVITTFQVHHGAEDSHITQKSIVDFQQEMRDRKADWSFTSHGNAYHGFTEPHIDSFNLPTLKYNKEADVRSWAATVALFSEKF
ncbi:unnamed protein product [Auanema sp. JU1783]|nr:unnamed protein product [Auanema sp. JU1783]